MVAVNAACCNRVMNVDVGFLGKGDADVQKDIHFI